MMQQAIQQADCYAMDVDGIIASGDGVVMLSAARPSPRMALACSPPKALRLPRTDNRLNPNTTTDGAFNLTIDTH